MLTGVGTIKTKTDRIIKAAFSFFKFIVYPPEAISVVSKILNEF